MIRPMTKDEVYKFEIEDGMKPIFFKVQTKDNLGPMFILGRGINEGNNISNGTMFCIKALKSLEQAINEMLAAYDTV